MSQHSVVVLVRLKSWAVLSPSLSDDYHYRKANNLTCKEGLMGFVCDIEQINLCLTSGSPEERHGFTR